jgi:hypothetical protein
VKRLIVLLVIAAIAWQGYGKYRSSHTARADNRSEPVGEVMSQAQPTLPQRDTASTTNYKCDGRTYCSQMNSCAEATYFLRNCPGVKMDGNNDGIPCEKQWCN